MNEGREGNIGSDSRCLKVLFYSDTPEFGGHELLTTQAIGYLSQFSYMQVCCILYAGNQRWLDHLRSSTSNVLIKTIDFRSRSLQGMRTFFGRRTRRLISGLIESFDPDVVLVSQGTIEISTIGIWAGKRAGYPTISYVPFVHSFADIGIRLGWLRDILNRYYYDLPDGFIVPSNGMKKLLISRGILPERIAVAYNGIDVKRFRQGNRVALREIYGLGDAEFVIGLVGRIVLKHKGHDVLVSTFARYRQELRGIRVVIFGDGPDSENLRALVRRLNLESVFVFCGWESDASRVYPVLDALIIPSRFEGVPVVMQEAMYYGVPIVASRIDGVAEFMPEEWTFQKEDEKGLRDTLLHVLHSDNRATIEQNKLKLRTQFSVEAFGQQFLHTVLQTVGIDTPDIAREML